MDLLHELHRHRQPVRGQELADNMGISLRTLYRDIATLQAQGADITGEAGVGYVLRPGFLLPPLMFPIEEIEALVLGSRWVAQRGDERLRDVACSALARIGAVLPPDLRAEMDDPSLMVGPSGMAIPGDSVAPALLRRAIRVQHKLQISYVDAQGARSARVVWPFGLAFFDNVRILLTWCETRNDFRHFRTDRIGEAQELPQRYPEHRQKLMQRWRAWDRARSNVCDAITDKN